MTRSESNYMTSSHRATARPFTIALCAPCRSPLGTAVLEQLRISVRRSAHGILVSTGCLLGEFTCLVRGNNLGGAVLMLQPCSIDRVARGAARWIGPIANATDLRTVCAWLERGQWESDQLPDRLRLDLTPTRRTVAAN